MPSVYVQTSEHLTETFRMITTQRTRKIHLLFFLEQDNRQCRRMVPLFEILSNRYPEVGFLTLDMSKCKGGYHHRDMDLVRNIPAFLFYRNRLPLDYVQGVDPGTLESKILRYSYCAAEFRGVSNLWEHIVFCNDYSPQLEYHNLPGIFPMLPIINNVAGGGRYESMYDPGLLISMCFAQPVDITALSIEAPATHGPKTIKLYTNQPYMSITFRNVGSKTPVADFTLTTNHQDGTFIGLKQYADALKNVKNLLIFVRDNLGGRVSTRIDALQVYGLPSYPAGSVDSNPSNNTTTHSSYASYWMYYVPDTL